MFLSAELLIVTLGPTVIGSHLRLLSFPAPAPPSRQELKSALQRARTTFVFIAGLYNAGQSDFAATLRRVLPKKALTCNSNIDRSILMSGNITTAARGAELQQRIANAARTAANSSSAAHRVVLVNTCLAAGTFPIDVDNERQGVSMMKHPNLLTLYQTFQDAGLELKVIFLQNSLRISSMFAREPPAPGRVRVIADNLRVLAYYLTDYPGDIACIDAGAPTLAAAESVSRLLNVPPVPDHAADLLRRLEAQLQKREANAARAGPSRPEWEQTSIRWTWQALKEVCALPGGDAHLPREA